MEILAFGIGAVLGAFFMGCYAEKVYIEKIDEPQHITFEVGVGYEPISDKHSETM